MKALGIVRKLDDLGRVVIPKEVRNMNGWKTGQPLEMFIDDKHLMIKGYQGEQKKQEVIHSLENLKNELSSEEEKEELNRSIEKIKEII